MLSVFFTIYINIQATEIEHNLRQKPVKALPCKYNTKNSSWEWSWAQYGTSFVACYISAWDKASTLCYFSVLTATAF